MVMEQTMEVTILVLTPPRPPQLEWEMLHHPPREEPQSTRSLLHDTMRQ